MTLELDQNNLPSTDGIAIPDLRFRRFATDAADYEAVASLLATSSLADGLDEITTSAQLRVEFQHLADFDPREDVLLAEAGDELIGYGHVYRDVRDDRPVYWTFGGVLPQFRRRGLGRRILHANERRLQEVAERFGAEEDRTFGTWVDEKEGGSHELLRSEGYEPIRYYFTMLRPHLDEVPDAPLPDGLDIRPVVPEDRRAIFDADNEAFRDHYGHKERTDDDFVAHLADPDLDTELWRVAWDGDEVAGSVMTYVYRTENETLGVRRGWLGHISVRRPWRRRGLAKALIASAIDGLRDAGMTEAMLGVDAENLTGAVRLYESVGFAQKDRGTRFQKAWPA